MLESLNKAWIFMWDTLLATFGPYVIFINTYKNGFFWNQYVQVRHHIDRNGEGKFDGNMVKKDLEEVKKFGFIVRATENN